MTELERQQAQSIKDVLRRLSPETLETYGRVAATSYAQGVQDGMTAADLAREKRSEEEGGSDNA